MSMGSGAAGEESGNLNNNGPGSPILSRQASQRYLVAGAAALGDALVSRTVDAA